MSDPEADPRYDENLQKLLIDFFTKNYAEEIDELAEDDYKDGIVVDYQELRSYNEQLATNNLAKTPDIWMFNAKLAVESFDEDSIDDPEVRLTNYDEYLPGIRDLRDTHIGKFISIDSVISKSTSVIPKGDKIVFECDSCLTRTTVKQPLSTDLEYPRACSNPDCDNSRDSMFSIDVSRSSKINFRKIEAQEPPDEVSGGNTPESETFTVQGEVANNASAGDRVQLTGIYRAAEQGNDTSVFKTYIEGNNIELEEQEFDEIEITEEEEEEIIELSEKDNIYELMLNSVAPSLYGLENEKEAVLYQLFRGIRKDKLETPIRGDIHVLLVGDPGVGKSQLLRYASKLSPRGMMTNGKGASSAGLTAAAVKDSEFGGSDKWTLEAGTLVLADKGIACVDELDKMKDSDRSAMHEGLEQQTISVAKAGINATLKSRCALLGAANPKDGRWNEFDAVPAQIDLEPALVSRFDLIFAPQDDRDEDRDSKLADIILRNNQRGQVLESKSITEKQVAEDDDEDYEDIEPDVPPDLFRKYVAYARKNCNPVMTQEAKEYLENFFVEIRGQADEGEAIPVTARKIEALVRLSESAARIRLSDTVEIEHAKRARGIVMESLKEVGYDEKAGEFDADLMESNQSTSQRQRRNQILKVIEENTEHGEEGAPEDLVIDIMVENNGHRQDEIESDINILQREGELYEPVTGEYDTL